MSKIICTDLLDRQYSLKKDNNYFNNTHIDHLYKSLCNELNKCLLKKEIEFDNVSTEEKKDDDKYNICTNFVINNLINILNKKDIVLRSNNINNKIQKKKINKDNNQLNTFFSSEHIGKSEMKKDKKKNETVKIKLSTAQLIENKNPSNQNNELKNINIIKNLQWMHKNNQYDQKKVNFLNKNNLNYIKDNKNLSNFSYIKTNKSNCIFSKDINKVDNLSRESNYLKFTSRENRSKSNIEPFFFHDIKNSLEWKKLIDQKILLFVSRKEHQAEIHLKPEYLGPVYIKIQMKNDQAILSFTSYNNKNKVFLNDSVSFLRDSLKKNGIELKKFNIHNAVFLKDKEFKKNDNLFDKTIVNSDKINKRSEFDKQYIERIKYKAIDIYV